MYHKMLIMKSTNKTWFHRQHFDYLYCILQNSHHPNSRSILLSTAFLLQYTLFFLDLMSLFVSMLFVCLWVGGVWCYIRAAKSEPLLEVHVWHGIGWNPLCWYNGLAAFRKTYAQKMLTNRYISSVTSKRSDIQAEITNIIHYELFRW